MCQRRRIAITILVVAVVLGVYLLVPRGVSTQPAGGEGTVVSAGSTAPFNTIYFFYSAVAANDWQTVQALTTPALWSYLKASGFVTEWEERRRLDPTTAFSLFLVSASTVDEEEDTAWALGEAQWTGGAGKPANNIQTVFLRRLNGGWRLTRIDGRSAVEVTTEFYQAIQEGKWLAMRSLVEPGYWGRLVARGVILSLQRDWAGSRTGIYVILHIKDFVQGEKSAWVTADVLWRPLTLYERETPVVVELVNTTGGWKIARISGHWEEAK